MEFNERELYLLLHAVDEAARRDGGTRATSFPIGMPEDPDREPELWALRDKLSKAGASYVFPRKQ